MKNTAPKEGLPRISVDYGGKNLDLPTSDLLNILISTVQGRIVFNATTGFTVEGVSIARGTEDSVLKEIRGQRDVHGNPFKTTKEAVDSWLKTHKTQSPPKAT